MNIFMGLCVIHDFTMRKEIGVCKLTNSLYHFSHEQALHTSMTSSELLYRRLGHPSLSLMEQIS